MQDLESNRLTRTFRELRSAGRKALLPFVTAGYPDLQTTALLLSDFQSRGVRVCELGFPYSDPIADGPVIQSSYTEALANGITSKRIFDMVQEFRGSRSGRLSDQGEDQRGPELALLAMVSYSIVFRHGVETFLREASDAGFDGTIIPDLPLDEAADLEPLAAAQGLCNVLLIAPTTPPARRLQIARRSRGFIYYVSVAGITGERTHLPEATSAAVAELRNHTGTPVCVGFGVSNAQTVRAVCEVADGAIVGSAIVHRIADAGARGMSRPELVQHVGEFVGELLSPIT
jgi:tryptophan synthase alpha chain